MTGRIHVKVKGEQRKIGGVSTSFGLSCDCCPSWSLDLRFLEAAVSIAGKHRDAHRGGLI